MDVAPKVCGDERSHDGWTEEVLTGPTETRQENDDVFQDKFLH